MATRPALVLSGGLALGAYHAGAWTALEAAGIEPFWVAGTSIGAITAAIIAGNAPGQRAAALSRFWDQATSFDPAANLPQAAHRPVQYLQAFSSRLLGRPGLFTLRPPDVTGTDTRPGLYDASALYRLLPKVVDFDRLNDGPTRVSVTAVDLASGEETVFDNRSGRLEPEHLMASSALPPDFPPVEIDGRLMVDGGVAANLPAHIILDHALIDGSEERLTLFAVDLFSSAAPLPLGIGQAAQRLGDLIFAGQTKRTLNAWSRIWGDRTPGAEVVSIAYEALEAETPLKGFDFSTGSLARRWAAGETDMQAQITRWRATPGTAAGLTIR